MDEAIVKIIRKIAFARTKHCVPVASQGLATDPATAAVSNAVSCAAGKYAAVPFVRPLPGWPISSCRISGHSVRLLALPTILLPLLLTSQQAFAEDIFGSQPLSDTDYKITMPGAAPAFNWQSDTEQQDSGVVSETRSEVLFKLSFDPQVELGEFGSAEKEGAWSGGLSMERIDFMPADELKMQDISQGFAYSARVDIEKTTGVLDESQIVSSRQLGVHYGRLGSVNYSGVDLGYRQFSDTEHTYDSGDKDLWSLGVTTGRRFSLTGLDESDPLWTVSLRGQFSLIENNDDKVKLDNHLWYLSPGLYWQHDSFELSADVLMPFMHSGETEEETDYRIRAKIQKRF